MENLKKILQKFTFENLKMLQISKYSNSIMSCKKNQKPTLPRTDADSWTAGLLRHGNPAGLFSYSGETVG